MPSIAAPKWQAGGPLSGCGVWQLRPWLLSQTDPSSNAAWASHQLSDHGQVAAWASYFIHLNKQYNSQHVVHSLDSFLGVKS